MADRVPSDHDAVETHRVPVERVGRTDRPRVVLPDAAGLAADAVIRLALDGEQYHALVETDLEGNTVITHVGDNARVTREREGTSRLAGWIADADVSLGGTAHLDVLAAGHEYGLRTPGTRVVYETTDPPSDSLADIANDLDN